ncbi:MAG: YdcH family protein [Thermaurantiacus tibetensis]
MTSAHLEALSARHAMIDGQIAAEMTRPLPDATKVTALKRQKLRLKEEMARAQ